MNIKLINVYNNDAEPQTGFIGAHGLSFLIQAGDENILFDTGGNGKILLNNLNLINIKPGQISTIIFSHGHFDHTLALPYFLNNYNCKERIKIFGHNELLEEKVIKIGPFKKQIGFPELDASQKEKITFNLSDNAQTIIPSLSTTGEIKIRNYNESFEKLCKIKEDGGYKIDPVRDDNSLVLKTNQGLVIILGCAHAGILNICDHVKRSYTEPIKMIIGGAHMVRYSRSEVEKTADILKDKFDYPDLHLNHCTDRLPSIFLKATPALEILKNCYGENKVVHCPVGTSFLFEI